jgi:hypothetical protein
MDEIISYKMCAVKVRNAKLRNYLKLLAIGGGISQSKRLDCAHPNDAFCVNRNCSLRPIIKKLMFLVRISAKKQGSGAFLSS